MGVEWNGARTDPMSGCHCTTEQYATSMPGKPDLLSAAHLLVALPCVKLHGCVPETDHADLQPPPMLIFFVAMCAKTCTCVLPSSMSHCPVAEHAVDFRMQASPLSWLPSCMCVWYDALGLNGLYVCKLNLGLQVVSCSSTVQIFIRCT